jgi:hypothetical protein
MRYIPVHDLCSSLSSITCEILPAVHALTGCDTTAIFGIGKKSVFKLSLTSSLFRLVWQELYFALGSYNFATTFLATHIEDSRSGSLSCERSGSSADEDCVQKHGSTMGLDRFGY